MNVQVHGPGPAEPFLGARDLFETERDIEQPVTVDIVPDRLLASGCRCGIPRQTAVEGQCNLRTVPGPPGVPLDHGIHLPSASAAQRFAGCSMMQPQNAHIRSGRARDCFPLISATSGPSENHRTGRTRPTVCKELCSRRERFVTPKARVRPVRSLYLAVWDPGHGGEVRVDSAGFEPAAFPVPGG